MNVLVTGGSGYLGSVLVGHLLRHGHCVTVLDSLLYGQMSLVSYATEPRFTFVRGDVRDESLLKRLLGDAEVIFPLAAVVGQKACDRDPHLAQTVNFDAVRMLNRLRSRSQRVIFPNTNSGYGATSGTMFCTEETDLAPISHYGRTKVQAEQELLQSENVVTLRLATVFGVSPRLRLDLLVNDFTFRAYSEKSLVIFEKDFRRNFLHIDDAAECFLFCLDHFEKMKGRPYNVGLNEANISKEQLALKIKEYVPDLYIHFAEVGSDPDKRNYVVSNERINKQGFTARRSLDQGIQEILKVCPMIRGAAVNSNA